MSRAASLAVDDAHAAPALVRCLREEIGKRVSRLVLGHAVQVELVAYRVLAAPQAPERRFRDAVAAEGELVPGFDLEVRSVESERFRQDAGLVGAAGRGARAAAHALRHRLRLPQRLRVPHGDAEQIAVLVLDVGILRPRAGAAALTV